MLECAKRNVYRSFMMTSLKSGFVRPRTTPTIVALTGFMGSGKTTVGRALAALLEWKFVDLDELIERRESLAIREIFAQRGEAGFREIEHQALSEVLAEYSRPTVIALGGGAFVQPNNAELLGREHIRTVFLDAPVEELLRRCGTAVDPDGENARPLAVDEASFRKLYEQRTPLYRKASLIVNSEGKNALSVARVIVEELHL